MMWTAENLIPSSWTILPGRMPMASSEWENDQSQRSLSGREKYPSSSTWLPGTVYTKESASSLWSFLSLSWNTVVWKKEKGLKQEIPVYAYAGREEIAEAIKWVLNSKTQPNSPEAMWIQTHIKESKNKVIKKILQTLYQKVNPQIIGSHTVAKIQLYEEWDKYSDGKDLFGLVNNVLVKLQQTIENMVKNEEQSQTIRVFAGDHWDEWTQPNNQKNWKEKLRDDINSNIQENQDIPQEIYTLDKAILKATVSMLLFFKKNSLFEKDKEIDFSAAIKKTVYPFAERKHELEWAKITIETRGGSYSKPTIFMSVNNTGGELFDLSDINGVLKSIEWHKAKKEASSQKKSENTTM